MDTLAPPPFFAQPSLPVLDSSKIYECGRSAFDDFKLTQVSVLQSAFALLVPGTLVCKVCQSFSDYPPPLMTKLS